MSQMFIKFIQCLQLPITADVILQAISGVFLLLLCIPLYQSIGFRCRSFVLALLAAVFVPPLTLLIRYGDWFRSREQFGKSGDGSLLYAIDTTYYEVFIMVYFIIK